MSINTYLTETSTILKFRLHNFTQRVIFNIFASLAEFERDLIRERTKSGLEDARARGRKGGRTRGLSRRKRKKRRC
ncbi:MAG TPA: recombinase family protein [Dyadobacter sp.]|nr:recombinase family protein [Dyadobacter sp.]